MSASRSHPLRPSPAGERSSSRASRPADGSPRRVGAAGFTLAELIVVIVVVGLIGAGVVGLMLDQNRFYGATEDRSFADGSRRGVADLVTSEVRMLATGGLRRVTADTILARFDLAQAVVCEVDGITNNVTLVVHHRPNPALPSGLTGTAYSSPFDSAFVYEDGWTSTLLAQGGGPLTPPKSTCVANGAPAGLAAEQYRIESWTGHPAGLPTAGAVVRVYGDLVYALRASDQGSGLALWRNDQELVAPFGGGAAFSYVMDDGSVQASVVPADHDDIRRVRVTAEALGGGANRHDVAQDLELDIPFRN